ncbi:MAG: hypothetical protein HQM14_10245 [SAR324 cluster bacterium]|nr:hypothetical protein [SAR324 cluster bacterium]
MIQRKHIINKTILIIGISLICYLLIPTCAIAQSFIVQQGKATVPIVNENVAQAENKAVFEAKQVIIQEVLPQLIDTTILAQVEQQIKTNILKNPDQFIESIRVIETSESENSAEFSILLEARIFKNKIISHLKQLNLSLLDDPTRQVTLFFDSKDSAWQNPTKKETIRTLNQLFKPYKLHIRKARPLNSAWVKSLTTHSKQPLPQQLILNSKSSALLFLDFQFKRLPSKNKKKPLFVKLQLNLYDASNGKYLKQANTAKTFNDWSAKQDAPELLNKLALTWNPLITALISAEKKSGDLVSIKLSGLSTPQQETIFLQNILNRQGLWDYIQLHTLANDYTMYHAVYSGNRQTLVSSLKQSSFPSYQVQSAVWNSDQLEIQFQSKETLSPLESYQPVDLVERWITEHKIKTPEKKVPTEKLKTVYTLPSETGVYDVIRSRGDSTLFKVESKHPLQKMTGKWQQIGKTNLSPELSVYDAQHHLIKRYAPKHNGMIEFQYQLPKDQSHFYIRINDQIGYLEGEAGSYLFVHYIIQILSS